MNIGAIDSSTAATWFEDPRAVYGERVLYESWDDLLLDIYERGQGTVRFRWYIRDRRFTSAEEDPGNVAVLLVERRHPKAGWLSAQLAQGCAHIRVDDFHVLVPVAKTDVPSFLNRLGDAVDVFSGIEASLGPDAHCTRGPLVAPPPPPHRITKEEFFAACEQSRRERAAEVARGADEAVRLAAQEAANSIVRQHVGDPKGAPVAGQSSPQVMSGEGKNEEAWCIMLPSIIIEPLALIMAGRGTLHGDEIRYGNEVLGHFDGKRGELEWLVGATPHRVLRRLLASQETHNHGELLGGVAALATAYGVNSKRAGLAIEALTKLRLAGGEPVLSVAAKKRVVAHHGRALPFELLGPFASGYFSRNKTINTNRGSRRLVPLPSGPLPTTDSNARRAAEMSLELLLFRWIREYGDYDEGSVAAPLAEFQLARLAERIGLPLAHARKELFGRAWKKRLRLFEHGEEREVYVGFLQSWLPEIFSAMRTGLFRTARARDNRRRAGQPC